MPDETPSQEPTPSPSQPQLPSGLSATPCASQTISNGPARLTETCEYEGDFAELRDALYESGLTVGSALNIGSAAANVAACRLERLPAGRGRLQLTLTVLWPLEVWELDFTEVQKPVKNWKAGTQDAPDLGKIAQWEALERDDPAHWAAFKIPNGSSWDDLTGNTLKLAQMILSGIQVFTVNAPVATRRTSVFGLPADIGSGLGTQTAQLAHRDGWADYVDGSDTMSAISALAPAWLKTADRATLNADGTFTRIEQWTGADAINPDLYPSSDTDPGEEEETE